MLSIRSLVLVSLGALSMLGASVQAQQPLVAGAQAPFWPFNAHFPQLHIWAAPMPMQPIPSPIPRQIPFPKPFWLWPIAPQLPVQTQPAAEPHRAENAPAPVSDASPPQPDSLPASTDIVAPPSASETPASLPADQTTALEPDLPRVESGDSPPASASVADMRLPTRPDSPGAPADSAPLAAPVEAAPQVVPAPPVNQAHSAVVKSRTATKKPARIIRKLCWKDGRLDVCP